MSHEIRTPMNGVLGMAAMALDSEPTSEQHDCLTTIQSSESLLKTLNDILSFSKIESRKLEAIPFTGRHAVQRSAENVVTGRG